MRGKQDRCLSAGYDCGITPADAGKTRALREQGETRWDHPRGCGENGLMTVISFLNLGSPPRMRGKHAVKFALDYVHRITPADAGKTLSDVDRDGNKKDHPRGCGENRLVLHRPLRQRGITPADAGKTNSAADCGHPDWDHPRGCGENDNQQRLQLQTPGSPPRMRGKLWTVNQELS